MNPIHTNVADDEPMVFAQPLSSAPPSVASHESESESDSDSGDASESEGGSDGGEDDDMPDESEEEAEEVEWDELEAEEAERDGPKGDSIDDDFRVHSHLYGDNAEDILDSLGECARAAHRAWLADEALGEAECHEEMDWPFYACNFARCAIESFAGVFTSPVDYTPLLCDLLLLDGRRRRSDFVYGTVNGYVHMLTRAVCPISGSSNPGSAAWESSLAIYEEADARTALGLCTVDWGARQQELLRLYLDEFCVPDEFPLGLFVKYVFDYWTDWHLDGAGAVPRTFTPLQEECICIVLSAEYFEPSLVQFGVDGWGSSTLASDREDAHAFMQDATNQFGRMLLTIPEETRDELFGPAP